MISGLFRRGCSRAILLALCAFGLTTTVWAKELPRKGRLGVYPVPAPAELLEAARAVAGRALPGGVLLQQIASNTSAKEIGLMPGDLLLSLNDKPVTTPQELIALAGLLRAGDPLTGRVFRGGQVVTFRGITKARETEAFVGATTELTTVTFDTGRLRAIMVTPTGVTNPPVVYLIQGYPCASMEAQSPVNPNRHFIEHLVSAGFAVWRVEKPDMGDSVGPKPCKDISFPYEVASFTAGYRALLERGDVDTNRLYVYGQSLGGSVAPFLAGEEKAPAGIATYGTAVKPWGDYMKDVVYYQGVITGEHKGPDLFEQAALMAPAINALFDDGKTIAETAKELPDAHKAFCAFYQCAGETLLGRAISFFQSLDKENMASVWAKVEVPVLSMIGESDVAVVDARDGAFIVTLVNATGAQNGTFVEIPRTNHFMGEVGTPAERRRHSRVGTYKSLQYNYNPMVGQTFLNWVAAVEAGKGR